MKKKSGNFAYKRVQRITKLTSSSKTTTFTFDNVDGEQNANHEHYQRSHSNCEDGRHTQRLCRAKNNKNIRSDTRNKILIQPTYMYTYSNEIPANSLWHLSYFLGKGSNASALERGTHMHFLQYTYSWSSTTLKF